MGEQRQRYSTKQEAIIIDFFRDNAHKHFTADEVCAAMLSEKISRSTVYRRLERLVEDGSLIKFNFGRDAGACYQFCCGHLGGNVLHFVCTKCKTVSHVDCYAVNEAFAHLTEHHKMVIDNSRTVIYGVCEGCVEGCIK